MTEYDQRLETRRVLVRLLERADEELFILVWNSTATIEEATALLPHLSKTQVFRISKELGGKYDDRLRPSSHNAPRHSKNTKGRWRWRRDANGEWESYMEVTR